MLRQRVIVTLILMPIGITAIVMGGWVFALFMLLMLGIAAWEFGNLFKAGGYRPASFMLILAVLSLVLSRFLTEFSWQPALIAFWLLASIFVHELDYERGNDKAGVDFAITLAGIFYIGILGAYFVSLRMIPEWGMWWFLVTLPGVWWADSGAYFIGSAWGKHKMAPRLSPKKSWQGYFGGILLANSTTLWSRNGNRPSTECPIIIRSPWVDSR